MPWCLPCRDTEEVSTACGVQVGQKRALHVEILKLYILLLTSFKDSVQGKSFKWHSVNQGAIRIVDILRLIFSILIVISMFKTILLFSTTGILPRSFFAHLDLIWGPYTVDRFADAFNAQLSRFNSRSRVRVQKLLTPFQSHGQQRLTGSFRQYIVLLG